MKLGHFVHDMKRCRVTHCMEHSSCHVIVIPVCIILEMPLVGVTLYPHITMHFHDHHSITSSHIKNKATFCITQPSIYSAEKPLAHEARTLCA